MFELLNQPGTDAIVHLMLQAQADTRAEVCDLTVGIYRDESGAIPMMEAVRKADMELAQTRPDKGYVGPLGDQEYVQAIKNLALPGGFHGHTVEGAQTPGGSSALRLALDVIKMARPDARVWVSDPGYTNHAPTAIAAGLELCYYPFFDARSGASRKKEFISLLSTLGEKDVIVFHGCCHNPTGLKITNDEWQQIAMLAKLQKFFPLLDTAYQGLGEGVVADAYGADCLLQNVDELALTYSCSKNFGLYSDRVGAVLFAGRDGGAVKKAQAQIAPAARPTYWVPPNNGAQIVKKILGSDELKALWENELTAMRNRINSIRAALLESLKQVSGSDRYDFLAQQSGMFSMFPATEAQMTQLREDYAIYGLPDGRLNVSGMKMSKVNYIAQSLHAVLSPD